MLWGLRLGTAGVINDKSLGSEKERWIKKETTWAS